MHVAVNEFEAIEPAVINTLENTNVKNYGKIARIVVYFGSNL